MNDNSSHDPSGFMSGLTMGLILGAAGSHYLNNTQEGQKILSSLKDKMGQSLSALKENPELAKKLGDLEATMEAAKATINTAAEHIAQATKPNSPKSKKKSFFQKMGVSLGK